MNQTRRELEGISERVLGKKNAQLSTKKEVVAQLMSKPRAVAAELGLKSSFWAGLGSHVYGLSSVLGLALGLAAFVGIKMSGASSESSQGPETEMDDKRRGDAMKAVEEARSHSIAPFKSEAGERILYKDIESIPLPTTSGFFIQEELAVCDLRGFRPLDSLEIRHEHGSPVVTRVVQQLRKVGDTAAYFLPSHTSGLEVYCKSTTHDVRVHASDEPVIFGRTQTKRRMVEFDVSSEPVGEEFDIEYAKTFWNAFQGPDQSWAGVTGGSETDHYTFIVLFPEGRPFTSIARSVRTQEGHPLSFPDEEYVLKDPDGRWIWWYIVDPKADLRYVIDWEWKL